VWRFPYFSLDATRVVAPMDCTSNMQWTDASQKPATPTTVRFYSEQAMDAMRRECVGHVAMCAEAFRTATSLRAELEQSRARVRELELQLQELQTQ
jgi:hypothetical protein